MMRPPRAPANAGARSSWARCTACEGSGDDETSDGLPARTQPAIYHHLLARAQLAHACKLVKLVRACHKP